MALSMLGATLERSLSLTVASLSCDDGVLVTLSASADGGQQADGPAIEKNGVLLLDVLTCLDFSLPTTLFLQKSLTIVDATIGISKQTSTRGRTTWARYEAEKLHFLLSYSVRLTRRARTTKAFHLGQIKKAYWESKDQHDRSSVCSSPRSEISDSPEHFPGSNVEMIILDSDNDDMSSCSDVAELIADVQEHEEANRRNLLLDSLPDEFPMIVSGEENWETEPAPAEAATQPLATAPAKTTEPPATTPTNTTEPPATTPTKIVQPYYARRDTKLALPSSRKLLDMIPEVMPLESNPKKQQREGCC